MTIEFASFDLDLDEDETPAAEPELCEADRYNQRSESYDGVCLAPLRADGTCPRAASHA